MEARAVPTATSTRVAEVVLAVAKAIANGAEAGPITLTRDDLANARGLLYLTDAGLFRKTDRPRRRVPGTNGSLR